MAGNQKKFIEIRVQNVGNGNEGLRWREKSWMVKSQVKVKTVNG